MRAAIVLAAGGSRRFGRRDKLLATLHGTPLLLHATDLARETGVRRVYVVVSSARTRQLLRRCPGVIVVHARDADRGLAASLSAGLRALRPIEREVLIFLGDMPFAAAARELRLDPGSNGVRPVWKNEPAHPMLVRVAAAKQMSLGGDQGLGAMPRVSHVRGKAANAVDIDSIAALRRVRFGSRIGSGR